MKQREVFRSGVMSLALAAFTLSLTLRCTAGPAEEADFPALQAKVRQSVGADDADFAARRADAKKSFKEVVTPFVDDYCSRCHGEKRQKGGINFAPALKRPSETA